MDMQVGCRWGVLLPVVAMVTVEFTDVGVTTVSKAAMSRGMSSYVFVVYSNALAAIFLLPCFILQKKPAASLPLSLLCGLFLLGLIGSSSLILAYNGINYSSPTVSSAMGNLIPIFTFVLAVIFRIEKLDLRKSSTRAKLLSTIVSVSGAFIVILYKGSAILTFKGLSPPNFSNQHFVSQQTNWVFGGFLLALSCLLAAIWNIVQAPIVNNFPSKVTIVFFYIFFVTIQTTIYSLIVERNPNSWVLRPDIEMIAIVCSAMFGSVFRTAVHVWCLQQNGPIFVTMFRPLGVAIAAAMVVIFLGESLHLGRKKPISLPLSFLCRLFLLGLIGSSAMLLAYSGIYYSSPTLSSAISNLSPIFTFILAIIFRMETLDLRRASSQGKLLGTLVSVSGAFVVVLYKGSIILKLKAVSTPDFLHPHLIISEQTMWVCGGLVLTMGCFFGALWNIALTSIVTNYPSKATFAFFYKFFMTIQCTIFSLILERNPNSWVLRPDFEMATIICSAVLGSVFRLGVYSWCVQQKGPIFVSMFKPLGVVIAAFMVVIFLGDALHLGSVIGSLIIAIGFYAMMWAQSKEKSNSMEKEVHSSASATQHAPLLQCRATEDV